MCKGPMQQQGGNNEYRGHWPGIMVRVGLWILPCIDVTSKKLVIVLDRSVYGNQQVLSCNGKKRWA